MGTEIKVKDDVSKNENDTSLSLYHRKYIYNGQNDERANINQNNVVYHEQNNRLIALADINNASSEKRYNKQVMTSKLPLPSEEYKHKIKAKRDKIAKKQTYNVTRDIKDVVNNISKEVGFPTSTDKSKIVQDDDKESDEAIKKYIVENNVAGIQREIKKIAQSHQVPKSSLRIRYNYT